MILIPEKYIKSAKLNMKMFKLVCSHHCVSEKEYGHSYDQVSGSYEDVYLPHLKPVTDKMLGEVGIVLASKLVDLGCGTGYTTRWLADHFSCHSIDSVDVSAKMLEKARVNCPDQNVTFHEEDMLAYLEQMDNISCGLITSAWSIGYSYPKKIIEEASRVLVNGGKFAFVVNQMDTFSTVFRAFRKTMAEFPGLVKYAMWPHYPKSWEEMEHVLSRNGFDIQWHVEGYLEFEDLNFKGPQLPWLLSTGLLAGFDSVLPLREQGPAADFFDRCLQNDPEPTRHHYVTAVCTKRQ